MTDQPSVAIPHDYTIEDGYDEQSGLELCPCCGVKYSANGGYMGAVFDQDGQRYGIIYDSDPDGGPFFCADCWDELDINRKAAENRTLEDFA